jgi:putative oxidoreductase
MKKISWVFRLTASIILIQTLYFKFTAHPESVELFTKLGAEPWGRVGTGVIELITGILLLLPSTVFIGAFLGIGLMCGAIASHITVIGIESKGDGGQLFYLAIITLVCCILTAYIYRQDRLKFIKTILKK